MLGHCEVYMAPPMLAKVFFLKEGGGKQKLAGLSTVSKNNEALLILKLKALVDCFLNLLIIKYLF